MRSEETRQAHVVPRHLVVGRGHRNQDALDVQPRELLRAIGEDHVLVPAQAGERGDQLARVGGRTADDADEGADADAHDQLRTFGATTGPAGEPVAMRSPASAPRPMAVTTSPRPRSA
jgi:hypothetical protein